MSRFSQNWDKIFKNGLWDSVFPEFAYLGKLLTVCYDDVIKFSHVGTLYLGKLHGPDMAMTSSITSGKRQ